MLLPLTPVQEDPSSILDIKEDIRDECAKLGNITNVILYDLEPEGVASVKFTDPDAANACVEVRGAPTPRRTMLTRLS